MKPLEIEIDGPRNETLAFRPLPGTTIRGRFDLNRVAEPMARLASIKWPAPIPGQCIGIDSEGKGYVREPLHDAEHTATREKILKRGLRIAPETQEFDGIDIPSWIYWLARAVQAGVARVTKGDLPAKLPDSPRTNFIMADAPRTESDRLAAAIERQNELMAKLLERSGK